MKASDLRLGNYVWNEVQNIPVVVDLRILNDQYYADKGVKQGWPPIRLNEEWLLKLGFIKDGECFYKEFKAQGEFFIFSNKTPVALANQISAPFYFTHKTLKPLIHVHQLQNLYYALVEEELKIK